MKAIIVLVVILSLFSIVPGGLAGKIGQQSQNRPQQGYMQARPQQHYVLVPVDNGGGYNGYHGNI